MVNTDHTVKWIDEFIEETNLRDVRVSIHTGEEGVWIAEITESGHVLLDGCGAYLIRGHGDTIVEALNDLDSRCKEDML